MKSFQGGRKQSCVVNKKAVMSCMVGFMHRVCMSTCIYLGHFEEAAAIELRLLHARVLPVCPSMHMLMASASLGPGAHQAGPSGGSGSCELCLHSCQGSC